MEKLRELHINDLPSDRIFVQFEEKSHKEIFDYLKKYKFDSLNTIFNNNIFVVGTIIKLNYSTIEIIAQPLEQYNKKEFVFLP